MRKTGIFLIGILLLLSLVNLVSAYTWTEYGSSFYSSITQSSNIESVYGNFQTVNSSTSSAVATQIYGDSGLIYHQPIIDQLGSSGKEYMILSNGNYLDVWDSNFNLLDEIQSRYSYGNIVAVDWDGDGGKEIAGFFYDSGNQSDASFRVYKFNASNELWIGKIAEFNITNFISPNYGRILGTRCISGTNSVCYAVGYNASSGGNMNITQFRMNRTDFTETHLGYSTSAGISEPPSFQDINGDGQREFFIYTSGGFFLYREDGTFLKQINISQVVTAELFHPDITSEWKIASIVTDTSACFSRGLNVTVWKIDGSKYWTKRIYCPTTSDYLQNSGRLAISDYNGDSFDDIFFAGLGSATTITYPLKLDIGVFAGNNGSFFAYRTNIPFNMTPAIGNYQGFLKSMTIAKMDNDDSYPDFVLLSTTLDNTGISQTAIYSVVKNQMLMRDSNGFLSGSGLESCVPADINSDGWLEDVCAGLYGSIYYSTNVGNNNSRLNAVGFSSFTVAVGGAVTINIDASDDESNTIYYVVKCSDTDSYSIPTISPFVSCSYGALGIYNVTVGVRDAFHTTYDLYSHDVTVTTNGLSCNSNGICESGEDATSCPSDCFSGGGEVIQNNETGGIQIPTKIVDTQNMNNGFLPMVYYGLLGFFSNSLQPMMILGFVFLFALIIIAIGTLVRKIFVKVGDLGR